MTSTTEAAALPYGVSVVIPTVGRPELRRAVGSVQAQSIDAPVQVLVVLDADLGKDAEIEIEAMGDEVEIVRTGGGHGAPVARNEGIARARYRWTAFLDDDDEWHATKLAVQVPRAESALSAGKLPVVSCRSELRPSAGGGSRVEGVPQSILTGVDDVSLERYLFLARRPGARRAGMPTSTLLTATRLAQAVPWDPALPRHQDWDWLLRLSDQRHVTMLHVPEQLVVSYVGSASSISAGADWASSLKWAEQVLAPRDRDAYVDFLAAQTLRYALHARSRRGVSDVLRAIRREGSAPSLRCLAIGCAGILPRPVLERLMGVFR